MNEENNDKIRVLLADDHPAMRKGIARMLMDSPDIEIVGEAETGKEAQEKVAELRPDILLLDLILPDVRPYEVEEWVRTNLPETTTLIITGHQREYFLAQAIKAQVAGFLTKDLHAEQLVAAIRQAARGESLFNEEQFERAARWQQEVGIPWASLSQREKNVLCWLAEGLSNEQIAETLKIAPKTIENYLWRILHKLPVDSRSEAIAWVLKNIPEAWREEYRQSNGK
ncbi:MAG: response regulator [Chloroflexota bacterium]